MKLKEYVEVINEIIERFGGDLDVIYSSDEEGNSFDKVFYFPTTGVFVNGEFEDTDKNPNCICIN